MYVLRSNGYPNFNHYLTVSISVPSGPVADYSSYIPNGKAYLLGFYSEANLYIGISDKAGVSELDQSLYGTDGAYRLLYPILCRTLQISNGNSGTATAQLLFGWN